MMLSVSNLNQFYGQSHTLWDLDIEVPEGACVSLMGRNGVGKTTFLKCIMGLLRIQSGNIRFDGVDLGHQPAEKRAALGIGYVPQGRMIFPLLTVEENLRIGLPMRQGGGRGLPERVFDIFPVLKSMLHRRGGDLSGGQQQQLAIGRALVIEPKFLILDEPTEGIQPNIVHEIGEVILDLNRNLGLTMLLIEQKLPFVQRVCDGFCIMDKGRLVASGRMKALNDELVKTYLTI